MSGSGYVEVADGVAPLRTQAESTREALARSEAELRRTNERLEELVYVVSHDLQEPLRMVSSFTGLLAQRHADHLDEEANRFIGFASDGAHRMSRMLEDLLVYSRVRKTSVPAASVPLQEVLCTALDRLETEIREVRARIDSEALPALPVDAPQMAQVFEHLIANALKFRSQAPPEISIRAQRGDERWVVCLSDNGIGVEPGYEEEVFRIFRRLHTRSEYEGTGMGLALCRRILAYHGGSIWIEPSAKAGTTVCFSLATNPTAAF